jgi:glycosyltransferase involved in cell wall biosynthesis
MRLLLVSSRELTRDVRARLEANGAVSAGLDVVGLSATRAGEEPLELDGVPVVRAHVGRLSGSLRKAGLGGLRRSPAPVRELRGLWRLARLVRTTLALLQAGRGLGRFDVVHSAGFDALPAAYLLARRSRALLAYDAQELYRYMESDPPRVYTRVASALEGWLARRAHGVVTCCDLFARELDRDLRLRRPATAFLTCPEPLAELPERPPAGTRLRAVYQAAADFEAKPVSDVLDALEVAPDVDLTIRLVEVDRAQLESEIARRGLGDRARLGDAVPPDRLLDGLVGFDAGIIVNRETTPNTALAVPNKLWEHMMAGLATVAPSLPGLTIVDELGVGATFEPGNPAELGRRLQEIAGNRDALAEMQRRARELALERFNSRMQVDVLRAAWGMRD